MFIIEIFYVVLLSCSGSCMRVSPFMNAHVAPANLFSYIIIKLLVVLYLPS